MLQNSTRARMLNVRLSNEEILALKNLATRGGHRSVSALIREWVKKSNVESQDSVASQDRAEKTRPKRPAQYWRRNDGRIYHGDSRGLLDITLDARSVDLIVTSPPFGLIKQKAYGNQPAHKYIDWFRDFARGMKRVLKPSGSLVIDIGPAWLKGVPAKSLYQFELLLMLCEEFGFYLAQDFYWWNPARMPAPAEWVNVRRLRVKDAVNPVWWLSPTPWPKASNRRVLTPYGKAQDALFRRGYNSGPRPSGHIVSEKWGSDNGGAIPPNLIAAANTNSDDHYQRYCRENDIEPHPARFPWALPEYFIRMLTNPGDLVVDPFAGSCITGAVAERLHRKWVCCELLEEYIEGALGRFPRGTYVAPKVPPEGYRVPVPKPASASTENLIDQYGGKPPSPKSTRHT